MPRDVCNINSIGKIKRRLRPDRRGCVDCGELLSRRAKDRCFECHKKQLRKRIGDKHPCYKGDHASSVAINASIIKRHGKANNCSNINCDGYSRKYKWARLVTRKGRRAGIWIQLCNRCRLRLSDFYKHNKLTEDNNKEKICNNQDGK